jgi:cellulose synthase/poly-beta-1,6-N-acetylglucosamine synthase-like glycosyltransferase
MALPEFLTALWLTPAVLAAAYYAALALVGLAGRPCRPTRQTPRHSFAIVIPARNEELGLPATLAACGALDYPRELCRVYVVADNCTDGTARVAVACGAVCLERHDRARIGKGHALAWAFERVLPDGHDAVVVLDADGRLSPGALRVFDRELGRGREVLQTALTASNPDESARSYWLAVGSVAEDRFFYAPKGRLGAAVLLRGSGMVFRRGVLERFPWQACSLAEDTEFSLRLLRAGVRIHYAGRARVTTPYAADARQVRVQRTRWAQGTFRLTRAHALRLLAAGVWRRRLLLVDAGWTLLVLSRPLVWLQAAGAVALAAFCQCLRPTPLGGAHLTAALIVVVAHALTVGLAVARLGVSRRRVALLCRGLPTLVRLAILSVGCLLHGDRRLTWNRTPRRERTERTKTTKRTERT